MDHSARRRLITLGVISVFLLLSRRAESGESAQQFTPCQVTAERYQLDGKQVTLSGRYYLNPHSSSDAPDLLGNINGCVRGDYAEAAVIVSFEHLSKSKESRVFQKYRDDLVPVECPPRTICMPPRVARYLYVDIVAVGRFAITNKTRTGYCCTLELLEILSSKLGPLNVKRSASHK